MKNLRYPLSYLFAVAVFFACILACRPGFSPDGRRIVFATFDEAAKTTFVRIYDRETGKIATLRSLPWPAPSNTIYCAASWSPSGAQVGLVATGTNEAKVEIIDSQSGRIIRSIPLTNDVEGIVMTPPVFAKDFLLFGGKALTRLNLRTGAVDYETSANDSNENEIYFFNNDKGVGYYAVTSDTNNKRTLEFGLMDVEHLKRQPDEKVMTDAHGWPDVTRDGKRFAIAKDSPPSFEIWSGGKLEKSIPTAFEHQTTVGTLVWSKDQQRIFAPVIHKVKDDEARIALIDVPTGGGDTKEVPLGTLNGKVDELMSMCQLNISPDGKALALGTPMGSVDEAKRPTAMYVIDLTGVKPLVKSVGFTETTKK